MILHLKQGKKLIPHYKWTLLLTLSCNSPTVEGYEMVIIWSKHIVTSYQSA
jgi:hypothetical protein